MQNSALMSVDLQHDHVLKVESIRLHKYNIEVSPELCTLPKLATIFVLKIHINRGAE